QQVHYVIDPSLQMTVPVGPDLNSDDGAGFGMAYWHGGLSYLNNPSPGNDEDENLATPLADVSIYVASLQGLDPEVYAHVDIPNDPALAASLESQILSSLTDPDSDGTYTLANGGIDLGFLSIPGSAGMTRLFSEDDALSGGDITSLPDPG